MGGLVDMINKNKRLLLIVGIWIVIILAVSTTWIILSNKSSVVSPFKNNITLSYGASTTFKINNADVVRSKLSTNDYDRLVGYLSLSAKYNISTINGVPLTKDDKDYLLDNNAPSCYECVEIDSVDMPINSTSYKEVSAQNDATILQIKAKLFDNDQWDYYLSAPNITNALTVISSDFSSNSYRLTFSESVSDREYAVLLSYDNNTWNIKIEIEKPDLSPVMATDDILIANCPVLKNLPYKSYTYSIGYDINYSKSTSVKVYIIIDSYPDTLNGALSKFLELSSGNSSKCPIVYVNSSNSFNHGSIK